MKTFRNLTLAFFIFSLTILTVGGAYTLWSNVTQVTVVDYTLTLDSTSNGLYVTLSGNLIDGTASPIIGGTVSLYTVINIAGDDPTLLTTVLTNSNGDYSYTYAVISEDTYYYRASYEVS